MKRLHCYIWIFLLLTGVLLPINAQYKSKIPGGQFDSPASLEGDNVPSQTYTKIIVEAGSEITKNGNFSWEATVTVNGTLNVSENFTAGYGGVKVNGSMNVSGSMKGGLTIGKGGQAVVSTMNGGSFNVAENGLLVVEEGGCTLDAAATIESNGRVEIFGDLKLKSSITIQKDGILIVHGSLSGLGNWGMNISGIMIVKGDFSASNGTINNDGNVVIGGNFTHGGGGFGGTKKDNFYIVGENAQVSAPDWSSVGKGNYGNTDDLLKNEADNDKLLNELGNLGLLQAGWSGDVSSEWSNKDNWKGKRVPSLLISAIVNVESGKHNPVIDGLASMRNLTVRGGILAIKPGSKVTITGDIVVKDPGRLVIEHNLGSMPSSVVHRGNSSGNVSVKVVYPAMARNWYLGHPVESNRDDYPSGFNVWNYFHGVGSEEWPSVAAGTAFASPVAGYVVQNKTGMEQTVVHTGKLATGEQKVAVSASSPNGFNLIANPYNGYLNPNALNFNGMKPTIWYRTVDSGYYRFQTYNVESGVVLPGNSSDLIPPMQAFWVRTYEDKELTFSNKLIGSDGGLFSLVHPVTATNPMIKSAKLLPDDVLYLQLSNNVSSDQTAIVFREGGNGNASRIDSYKRLNESKIPDFYTIKQGVKTAINVLPVLGENISVDLGMGLKAGGNTNLRIEAINAGNFMPGVAIWLVDTYVGKRIDLRNESYGFESSAGSFNDRFRLEIVKVSTGIEGAEVEKDDLSVSVRYNDNCIVVGLSNQNDPFTVNVYNVSGQLVIAVNGNSGKVEIGIPSSGKIYVVEVLTGKNAVRKKIVH